MNPALCLSNLIISLSLAWEGRESGTAKSTKEISRIAITKITKSLKFKFKRINLFSI